MTFLEILNISQALSKVMLALPVRTSDSKDINLSINQNLGLLQGDALGPLRIEAFSVSDKDRMQRVTTIY